ncbi:hypothetical protein [Henriciella sp.]|uniref:hypothetical protein n=1 Tax=Henriciella sp. TaxID=1968823 RepID=UPI000C0DB5DA|nr:hypothetical protein [Henriciella sp.]PHR83113.1 MAG: hypothetical protein COA64_00210 [Henriciella sp.]
MARTKQSRRKRKQKLRPEFQVSGPREREPSGRVKSKPGNIAARKQKPSRAQQLRLDLLKGSSGTPDDPLLVAKTQGLLTDDQHEALHRYRQITEAYRASIQAPREAPDILGTLQPRRGEKITTEEALIRLKGIHGAMEDCLVGCRIAERERLQMVVAEWGRYFTPHTCEILQHPARRLARHFWPERFTQKFGEAA